MSFGVPLGIAGVGLIGGSIALRARGRGIEVIGFDRDAACTALIDRRVDSLEALAEVSRTLVLALPVDATLHAIAALRERPAGPLELVLDVASVKNPIVRSAADWQIFAPTHPIAGAEQSGAAAARGDLFVERVWTYVPTDRARDAAVRGFIEEMGARPFPIDAGEHDRVLALTSHLPQVVVCALAAMLEERDLPAALAGPGLASTLRLAGSPWELWEPILRANSAAVAQALRELAGRLQGVADDLEAGTLRRTASNFRSARAAFDAFVKPWR